MAFGEREKGIKNSVRIWGRGSARFQNRPVGTGLRRLCLDGSAFDRDREFYRLSPAELQISGGETRRKEHRLDWSQRLLRKIGYLFTNSVIKYIYDRIARLHDCVRVIDVNNNQ